MQGWIDKYRIAIGAFLVIGIIAGGCVLWWLRTRSVPIRVTQTDDAPDQEVVAVDDQSTVFVDVEGAVLKPGVYELASDARVEDALQAAGGLTPDADLDRFGLSRAARVSDEQKIYMPRQGETLTAASNTDGSTVAGASTSNCVNINTASASQLDELDGIGEARVTKIVENRPYAKIEELVDKKVIPQSVFEGIKEQICVL
jgi:competence protein ComEA